MDAKMPAKVTVKFERERILDYVSVDEFIALQSNDLKAVKDVCGKFVVGEDGEYLPAEEGILLLGKASLRSLQEIGTQFVEATRDGLTPLQSVEASEMPS